MKKQKSTKYHNVAVFIKEYIEKNNLSHGDKLPTENELGEILKVSRITVRRAISELQLEGKVTSFQGSGIFVNKTKEKEKHIRYIPLVIPGESERNELYEVVLGVEKYLSANNFAPTVHFTHRDSGAERSLIKSLVDAGSDHIIIFPRTAKDNDNFYIKMQNKGVKFVFLDRMPLNVTGSLVTCDNFNGGLIATNHLIEQGCKKIAYVCLTDINEANSVVRRMEGYRFSLTQNNLKTNDEMIFLLKNDENILDFFQQIFEHSPLPDGIFCANDLCAIKVLQYLKKNSIKVPEDIAIIGFDNMPPLRTHSFSISTIEQSFFNMGYEAAEIICQMINKKIKYELHKVLPVNLIVRKSTKRIKK